MEVTSWSIVMMMEQVFKSEKEKSQVDEKMGDAEAQQRRGHFIVGSIGSGRP